MSKLLKRVPLDFKWPINKVWEGYINPYENLSVQCPQCDSGRSLNASILYARWYGNPIRTISQSYFKPEMRGSVPVQPDDPYVVEGITRKVNRDQQSINYYGTTPDCIHREAVRMCRLWNSSWLHHINQGDVEALLKESRLMEFTHTWTREGGWVKKDPEYIPTAAEINKWSLFGMGHDSINAHIVIRAECERLGVSDCCPHCGGEAVIWPTPEDKEKYQNWEPVEPPAGEGYQLWDNNKESPQSPVFDNLHDLCHWYAKNANTFAYEKATSAEWQKMLEEDFVCHVEGNTIFC